MLGDGMNYRLPCDLWGWRGTALVLVALFTPLLAVVTLARGGDGAETAAAARAIFIGSAALASAGLLQAHGRLAGNEHSQWLSVALGILALAGLTRGGYALTHPDDVRRHGTTVMVVSVCLMLTLVGLVLLAAQSRSVSPLVVGVPVGALLLVLQHAAVLAGPVLDARLAPVLGAILCLVTLAFALALLRLAALPDWARVRFAAATVLGGVSVAVEAPPQLEAARSSVALALGIVAGVLLTTTAAALLRLVVTEEQDHLSDLRGRLADVEAAQRADLARLHEINTLVAGIASASRLVREIPPSDDRERLQRMIDAELDRLQRTLAERAGQLRYAGPTPRAGQSSQVDLGELVERIALVHRARGHCVTSLPTEVRVPGDADAVAEVLDALVENAAMHGSPEDITIAVERVGDGVEIAVSDRGPGVTPLVQDNLFRWGAHRPGSPGRGIGLYAAHARARRLGGTLRLEEAPTGARFVLHLPDTAEGVDVRDRLAVVAS
jgi:signal transduction histidine kinase